MTVSASRTALLLATSLTAALLPLAARADSSSQLAAIERQIKALTAELNRMKHDEAVRNAQIRAVQQQAAHTQATLDMRAVTSPTYVPEGYALVPTKTGKNGAAEMVKQYDGSFLAQLKSGTFEVGGVRVTLGGFIEAASIFRTRNEVADITSNFNTGIPLPNSPAYHENEERFSARQSRFSMLVQGNPDQVTTLSSYFEGDLLGGAPTANSNESNSYNPRVRHAFAVYDRSDLGFYFLGGQTWSLLTMSKSGIPWQVGDMNLPQTIDAQYVPGFIWARQPGFRVEKSFDEHHFALAASVENPQNVYYAGPNGAFPSALGTINDANAGGSGFPSTNNFSTEVAPDIVVKGVMDPGWGHFEAYGIARFPHDRVSTVGDGTSKTTTAGGAGAAMLLPIFPDYLNFEARFLAGRGIGRYGTSQLPDETIGRSGKPDPLSEVMGMVGLTGHPIKAVDLYAYGGTEQIGRRYYDYGGKAYGYGNPLYPNTSCETELGASSDCVANTSGIIQGTIGGWWRFENGEYGTMQVGPQYSYTHRTVYSGVGPTPKTDENILLFSFRYYPFQGSRSFQSQH
jgi:hypothetical protein